MKKQGPQIFKVDVYGAKVEVYDAKVEVYDAKVDVYGSKVDQPGKSADPFLAMFISFSGIVSLPVLLQVTLGYSKSFTGNYQAFISLTAVITAGIMPRVVKAITAKGTLAVAFCSFCVAFSLFASLHDMKWMVVAAVFTGIGFGLTIPLLNHLTVERSPAKHRGRYLGFYSTANFGGQFFSSITTTFVSGSVSFCIVAALAIVTFLFVILIFRNK